MTAKPSFGSQTTIQADDPALMAWEVSGADFPHAGLKREKWRFLLRYAVLAPSSYNTQPWRFHLRDNRLDLYADRTRACRVVDPEDRELIMSCGCALFHLRTAMAHFGYLGGVTLFPELDNPDLLARVEMGLLEQATPAESLLFHAIPKRRTNRQQFSGDPVPLPLLQALREAAKAESAWFHVINGDKARHGVAELVDEGDRRQWEDKRFRQELARWVHSNHSAARDGIPGYAQGINDLLSYAGPLVVRTFDMGEGQAAQNHELVIGSPVMAVIGTGGDTPLDWIHAGQALARVLLRARVEDVWGSFLNQAIELPDLRRKLATAIGMTGFPQNCLRLGFADDVKPTPRREVDEVLV
jgi:hypothetical protein